MQIEKVITIPILSSVIFKSVVNVIKYFNYKSLLGYFIQILSFYLFFFINLFLF